MKIVRVPLFALVMAVCATGIGVLPAEAGSNGSAPLRHAVSKQAVTANIEKSLSQTGVNSAWRGDILATLTVEWWQWLYSIPNSSVLGSDPSGANCRINQRGAVWFLSAPVGVTIYNACTVPAGKAVLTAVFASIDDYPCPDPTFAPEPGQSLEHFLQADLGPFIDQVSNVSATLDNRPLQVRRVKTSLFAFTAAASNIDVDPCITGSPQLGVSDGYFTFINPLSPGQHTLRLLSSFGGGPATDVTTTLTVR